MFFYSTSGKEKWISFKTAVLNGFSFDGGLYLPQSLPKVIDLIKTIKEISFQELSFELGKIIFKNEFSKKELSGITEEAFTFPLPFRSLTQELHILELFHGPSFSFKDIGARFLATLLKVWQEKEIVVLVATSGDTGSAVGKAFYGLSGIRVLVLYPANKIAPTQETQLTTIGCNVKAVKVDGSFETCQELVKKAILDRALKRKMIVTTANSINIARIFPQAFYYFYAYCQLLKSKESIIFSVPCGNFGHLVSGIFAKRMGLPISRFIAATNINNEIPLFLHSGVFKPREALKSMAVSMDVGNPSNFSRLVALYGGSLERMREEILGVSYTDDQIVETIKQIYTDYRYLLDPHSAVGCRALESYLKLERGKGIFFGTAHPGKFKEYIASYIPASIPVPEELERVKKLPPDFVAIPPTYQALKELIITSKL